MMSARFITLEGGEGVGKTTNIAYIQSLLKSENIPLVLTREPGGTALAENIRQLLLDKEQEAIAEQTELLMMFAARAQHIKHVIKPALDRGDWVLCDRFTDATYAYQGGGRNMDLSTIQWLENFVQADLRPDLTLLLDAPIELGMQRAQQRGKLDRFESEKMAFFDKVRQAYLSIAEQQPKRVKIVDATQSLDNVQSQIKQILSPFIHE
ncbi:dTMP kinase [Methylococcaceae bacterium CS1]|uniref:dTMP kinase n=1 Tax=Bathymodiolus platifrons methanotrophic gill symbiont TaxID=113268 RepID=UPI000B418B4B|nr:dTMP kinase [Bathymodiolus platifrons methanotrophic gill symbiont]MCK5869142.1 dTMP kinase [Methyloprofundus sp.]TXK97294.1 dTMP kinase [Methylococcaceae bacterium CS4]TXK99166.1 dTMP kinase [Methylococcaceae bacterium CS5]TXL08627.1 dTMP kinase [Methylococcaceae bacterium CS1]TXL08730.1 dTMP kinase [Methylococcaceae bacterium CS3]TXL12271.1 dTMP kinase [Methylococcaceae bacterium CS2]